LALLSVAAAATASARPVHETDADDTPGPLDVMRVDKSATTPPVYTVTTWRRWATAPMWDHGYVLIYFDTYAGARFDYYVLVDSNGRNMDAALWHNRLRRPPTRLAFLPAWRPSARSVRVKVRRSRMFFGPGRRRYRWAVKTLYTGPHCPRVCIDRVPNEGTVVEPRPGIAPSPSPSTS
jgi:hypothetical protein